MKIVSFLSTYFNNSFELVEFTLILLKREIKPKNIIVFNHLKFLYNLIGEKIFLITVCLINNLYVKYYF